MKVIGAMISLNQNWEGPGWMKRKLFSQPAGPQSLDQKGDSGIGEKIVDNPFLNSDIELLSKITVAAQIFVF